MRPATHDDSGHSRSVRRVTMRALASLLLALLLACCAAPAPQQAPGDARTASSAPPPASPGPVATVPATPPPTASAQAGSAAAEPATVTNPAGPAAPDRNCRTDSDCAVKDIGNCCGYFPMCVNKDARTDPAAVRAACEASGMASICGFQEVKGCRCVENRCENLDGPQPEAM